MFPKVQLLRHILSLLLIAMLLTDPATASSPTWLTSFSDALNAAKSAQKRILVDITADWCGWCKKMRTDVFDQAEFKVYARDHFILLEINADKNRDFLEQFDLEGFPTVLILDPSGKEIHRIVGFRPLSDFLAALRHLPQ